MPLDAELLALLACPCCRHELKTVDNETGLLCVSCALVFPVKDGIPVLIKEEAVPKDQWERA